jgi:tight adherence protein C
MTPLLAIGLILLAGAAALVVRAITISRLHMAEQLREIDDYGFNAAAQDAAPAARARPVLDRVNELAARVGLATQGTGWRTPVPTVKLRAAGLYSLRAEVFHGYRVILAVGLPSLLFLDVAFAGSLSPLSVLLIATTGALAWSGPAALVNSRAQRRMNLIDGDLPELIDLLIATVEAGLGFAGSLQLVADRFDGPLGDELRLTLREVNLGLSVEAALGNLMERCETPSVRAFVRAVCQGESLGVSIGTMMRDLAAETRKRRRQAASERIQKAPVKMLFPLVFMVFPALFIVLLYPAAYQVLQQLGGR